MEVYSKLKHMFSKFKHMLHIGTLGFEHVEHIHVEHGPVTKQP